MEYVQTPVVQIEEERFNEYGIELFLKREDLTDPIISGNKYRKLLYNLEAAREAGHTTLLTFGGAYSNHIHATAYAGYKFGFNTIGVIRGEESLPLNPTLTDAAAYGMEFYYISRTAYREKYQSELLQHFQDRFGEFYLVPEGGSNALAVKGCAQILSVDEKNFDYYCCACGTGGTISGIVASLEGEKEVIGFPALKNGSFLMKDIEKLLEQYSERKYDNYHLNTDYHFGGYAKWDLQLISFINRFYQKHHIGLDPVYTGKLLFGIYDLAERGFFRRESKILAIHTGGLQGIRGFNDRFGALIQTS
ncbi:MAG: pyridoxal-phosphate dependent enzyme [Cyclobacteriaceae bacterium]|nr:pyridoxal-phosphate dependent enzyme [Cyclobacteriaceae bacterium]